MCAPHHAAPPLTLHLLGPFEARVNGVPLPHLRTRKGQWMLALLALRHGRDVERAWLAGTLWPDSDELRAHQSLRVALTDLRRALGDEAWRLLAPTNSLLRLDLTDADVDVIAFDAAIERGRTDGRDKPHLEAGRPSASKQVGTTVRAALEEAIRHYRGPLLEGCVEEWAFPERQAREVAYLRALERLAAAATARPEHGEAASHLRLAVAADPFREDLQRALMEALAGSGNPAGALIVYRQYRDLLRREMAAEPAEATTALFRRLRDESRARSRSLAFSLPPSATPSSPPSPGPPRNLPQPLSVFVGRERELREVGACLESARLVTLTGTGGIGKTRLAICVAEESAGEYADGAWFVDLAPLADATLVPQAVARMLRVSEAPGSPLTETLRVALGARQLLLVLDNCEHLIDACARLADELLSGCPHLRILATSRQPLGLTGEVAWRVPSLSLPEASGARREASEITPGPAAQGDGFQRTDALRLTPYACLLQSEAVRLLVERAQAAVPGFALTEQNALAVLQVCRRLDGIPLAIELAAARLRVLSVEQIAARLHDRFRLLTGGSRTALPRQQTLRATLDWSYALLEEPERILLRRISIFTGGFTLEAAEAVCSDFGFSILDFGLPTDPSDARSATPAPPIQNPKSEIQNQDVLDLLTSLVDQSLVGVERRGEAVRYVLLESTRDYARDRLREAEGGEERRARHAQYFLALAERAGPGLRSAAQVDWLQRLEEEHDNLRAAIDDFQARGAVEEGLRLVSELGWFWWMRGYFAEGRERLQALLAQSGYTIGSAEPYTQPPAPPLEEWRRLRLAQAKALNVAGMLADDQSDYEAARALFGESLALSRELGDEAGAAAALSNLGGQALHARDCPAARALYAESLAIWRGIGDLWWTASSLTNLGRVALLDEEYTTARSLIESALEIQRQLQDRRAIARSLTTLGIAAARLDDYEAAHALHAESLGIVRELGAKQAIEETLRALGSIASERGDQGAALAFHEERLTIAREMGSAWGIAESLYYLGLLARDRGEGSRAATLWSESLAISQGLGDEPRIAECLEGFASLASPPRPLDLSGGVRGSSVLAETDGRPERAQRAARLLGAAAALRKRVGAPVASRYRAEHERQVAATRAMLDPAAFTAAWEEGRTMPLEEVIAAALGEGAGGEGGG